jgi:hypothetical protein
VKALLGFVMNAKYARQETVGLEEMGLCVKFVEGEAGNTYENKTAEWIAQRIYGTHFARLVRVRSPQDALGRRVVDDGGNVRWEGLHNPSLYDEAKREGVVVSLGGRSVWNINPGSTYEAFLRTETGEEAAIKLLRSCISRGGTHVLGIVDEDTERGKELFSALEKYWTKHYVELHFVGEEQDEKPDVVATRVPRKHPHDSAEQLLGAAMHGAVMVEKKKEFYSSLSRLPGRGIQGNRRFKATNGRNARVQAGQWLATNGMVDEPYVPLDTLDMDNPKNEVERFMNLGPAIISVGGSSKVAVGHAPGEPRGESPSVLRAEYVHRQLVRAGVLMDTCVPVDA